MTTITLQTKIKAPIDKVFDLSRNIDVHMKTMSHTQEKAIDGRTSGCIELGETVRWRGKHFGFYVEHESIISALEKPNHFTDEMVDGHFKWLKHNHIFKEENEQTTMIDHFSYQTPFGIFGWLFDQLLLKKHLTTILEKRSEQIKELAEDEIL
ncbi:SRPBCC family protein [Pseudofulvibacter geojedonensis]|uniref:Cell division protein n=1 Tax=Pseudofulvibacter geojedonensis TaxID=1123758 RepID=A0ABW3I5G3_9FLAO